MAGKEAQDHASWRSTCPCQVHPLLHSRDMAQTWAALLIVPGEVSDTSA